MMDMILTVSMIFFLYCNRTIIQGISPGFRTGIWLVFVCSFLHFSSGEGVDATMRNNCPFPISIYWNGERSSVLQPDQPNPIDLKPTHVTSFSLMPSGGSLIKFWACNPAHKDCNPRNDSTTVAALSVGNETNWYRSSAENGYNLALLIMALGYPECPTISCTANLTDCPADLRDTDSNGNIIGCRLPDDCDKECLNYWSNLKGSDCFKEASTCAAGVALEITFCPT